MMAGGAPNGRVRGWRRRHWWVTIPITMYFAVVLVAMIFEESLIFFPMRYPEGDWNPAGLEFEDAWFDAPDGTRLHGWYLPHASPRGVMLIAHGNAGNVTHRADQLRYLHYQLNLSVLVFDYRGYGRSEGRPDGPGVLADARAARRWLAGRTGLSPREIILYGESLGSAVMVDLASDGGARALILTNAFSSLADVAAHHYPLLPVRLLMRTRLDAAAKIPEYHGPLLMCHGNADTIIPYPLGRQLFDAANQPKQWITLPRHDHNDPLPPLWWDAMDRFLQQLEAGQVAPGE